MTATSSAEPRRASRPRRSLWRDGSRRAARCGAGRPGAPEHAQHVAVEFVHPVIVGTRALPAVALVDDDAATALRPMARAGDALIVVADADAAHRRHPAAGRGVGAHHHLAGRGSSPARSHGPARACGSATIRPPATTAASCSATTSSGSSPTSASSTPVSSRPSTTSRTSASPARTRAAWVRSSAATDDDATVRTASGIETVSTLLVGPVHPGDLVLVHAGTAIPWWTRDRLPLPVHRARRARRRVRCSTDLAASAEAKAATSARAPRRDARGARRRAGRDRRRHGVPVRGRWPALRLRQRRQLDGRRRCRRPLRRTRRADVRCPPGRSSPITPCSPRSPTTSATSSCSPASSSRRRAPARHRRRPVDERKLGQPAARLRRGATPRPAHGRAGGLRRRHAWRRRGRSTTASSCGPTACTASRRSRALSCSTCGSACSVGLIEEGPDVH